MIGNVGRALALCGRAGVLAVLCWLHGSAAAATVDYISAAVIAPHDFTSKFSSGTVAEPATFTDTSNASVSLGAGDVLDIASATISQVSIKSAKLSTPLKTAAGTAVEVRPGGVTHFDQINVAGFENARLTVVFQGGHAIKWTPVLPGGGYGQARTTTPKSDVTVVLNIAPFDDTASPLSLTQVDVTSSDPSCAGQTGLDSTAWLSNVSVKSTGGPAVVTVEIASVFGETTLPFRAFGVDISSTLPSGNTASTQYAKEELYARKGGIVNLIGSIAYRDVSVCGLVGNVRKKATDHNYVLVWPWQKLSSSEMDKKANEELLFFVSHGFGVRGVSTNRNASAQTNNVSNGAFGSAYLGLGFDGPLWDDLSSQNALTNSPSGFVSFEVFAAITTGATKVLSSMFSPSPPRTISNIGAAATINLPGSFTLSVDYYRPTGMYGHQYIGDLLMFSMGYNRPK